MISAYKIGKSILAAVSAPPFETADDVRRVFDVLNEADISWHPDDDPRTVVWSIPLTDNQQQVLAAIADRLWTECDRFGLDIHEEAMQSHVRIHKEKSPFYPEHRPYEIREWMCFWGDGYTNDWTVKHEIHGVKSFNKDNGYEREIAQQILSLEIGETADLTDLSGSHWVTRIK